MTWNKQTANLMTRWSETVTPENAWREYPRPQMVRTDWVNLNGLWQYAITAREAGRPAAFDGEILVPYPLESALSGVHRQLTPDERLWYRRTFRLPLAWQGQRILLHFGAVDWETTVWINGVELGAHHGGYLPFQYDITPHLQDGDNELLVAVWDPTDASWQSRGKQVRRPRSIWYTPISGIWQTVWLEPVADVYTEALKLTPDIDTNRLLLEVDLSGAIARAQQVRVWAAYGGQVVAMTHAVPGQELVLEIPDPRLWSPEHPELYDLTVEVWSANSTLDRVESYFAMRKFSLGKDGQGRTRLCLNNRPLFQYGPLDQGYWPDGLYIPPSDDAMRFDLEVIKDLGCNMLRKHIKVEPARYYYYCDRLGLIVWQDMISGGRWTSEDIPPETQLTGIGRKDGTDEYHISGRQEVESRQDYWRELTEMIDHLYSFPCIGVWVPFNEAWGQFDAGPVATWLKAYDPTRPVDHASGWYDQGAGDLRSLHIYRHPLLQLPPEPYRALVLSEFGGYSMPVPGHLWNPDAEYGYRHCQTSAELTDAYVDLIELQLLPWIEQGLSAAVYTQTCDVEIELNGYLTYDRAVMKMDMRRVRDVHHRMLLCASGPHSEVKIETDGVAA